METKTLSLKRRMTYKSLETQDPEAARRVVADQLLERVIQLARDETQIQPSTVAFLDSLILGAAEALKGPGAMARDASMIAGDPLQAARDRGRHQALAELQRPENLSLRDAAAYAGRSDRAINEARLQGQLYALVPPGKQRGLRYPQWQLDAEAARLAAVLAPFIEAGASCWVVHNFMQRPLHVLGDARPMDWILDASKPVEPVVQAVKDRYAGEQGAA